MTAPDGKHYHVHMLDAADNSGATWVEYAGMEGESYGDLAQALADAEWHAERQSAPALKVGDREWRATFHDIDDERGGYVVVVECDFEALDGEGCSQVPGLEPTADGPAEMPAHEHYGDELDDDECAICGVLFCPDTHKAVAYVHESSETFHVDGSTCFLHPFATLEAARAAR